MSWLIEQPSSLWTGVTASDVRLNVLEQSYVRKIRRQDRLVVGKWSDPHLLSGERYDVVIAQYLLGALERFEPYTAGSLFQRLRPLVGERLYVIGLQPGRELGNLDGLLLTRLHNFRDSAFLHSDARHYREYPLDWVQERLHSSGFNIERTLCFEKSYGEAYVNRLIDVGLSRVSGCWDPVFAAAFQEHGERLRNEALDVVKKRSLRGGFDYFVEARPV